MSSAHHPQTRLRNRQAGLEPYWRLVHAYEQSLLHRVSRWKFAVEVEGLHSADLSTATLEALVAAGWFEHKVETTAPRGIRRSFRASKVIAFSERSCVVLTEDAYLVIREALARAGLAPRLALAPQGRKGKRSRIQPYWDADSRQLYLGRLLVKQIEKPAVDQELMLASFQEQRWRQGVDDPLKPVADQVGGQRLHNTIKNLNRRQRRPGIHFRADGARRRIYWEIAL